MDPPSNIAEWVGYDLFLIYGLWLHPFYSSYHTEIHTLQGYYDANYNIGILAARPYRSNKSM